VLTLKLSLWVKPSSATLNVIYLLRMKGEVNGIVKFFT
jgi:hypothetical protein